MTQPGKLRDPWLIYKGYAFSKLMTFKDADGNPVDLSGYTANFKAKPSFTYATDTINLTETSGITLGGAAGTIQIDIDATTTAAIIEDSMIFTLALNDAPVMYGKINVSTEVV